MGDSLKVHVFDDPGVEMLPDSAGCLCYKHCKNCVFFYTDFTFCTYSLIWCPEGGSWVSFWNLLVTVGTLFMVFEGLGDRLEI